MQRRIGKTNGISPGACWRERLGSVPPGAPQRHPPAATPRRAPEPGGARRAPPLVVVRAILLDPEARGDFKDPVAEPNYGKLREPVLFITHILRAFHATSDGVLDSVNVEGSAIGSADMSQDVFRAPSVFNFYPPTVRVPGEASVLGPPFAIFSSLTSLRWDNFVNRVIFATIPAALPNRPTGIAIDLSPWETLAGDPDQLIAVLNGLLLHSTMSGRRDVAHRQRYGGQDSSR